MLKFTKNFLHDEKPKIFHKSIYSFWIARQNKFASGILSTAYTAVYTFLIDKCQFILDNWWTMALKFRIKILEYTISGHGEF